MIYLIIVVLFFEIMIWGVVNKINDDVKSIKLKSNWKDSEWKYKEK